MNVTSYPTRIHTAFNPILVKCTPTNSETKAVLKIAKGHYDTLPTDFITIEREYFNAETTFDLSSKIKKLFDNTVSRSSTIDNNNLKVYYSVFNGLTDSLIYKGTALNAVVQVGRSTDLTQYLGYFLTKFNSLRFYEGYPQDIYALGYEGIETFVMYGGDTLTSTLLSHFGVPLHCTDSIELSTSEDDIYLRNNAGQIIYNNLGEPITIYTVGDGMQRGLPVECLCVPKSPFYVRWINDMGGVDYWMFNKRQIIQSNIKNIDTYKPVWTNNETTTETDKILGIETEDMVKVGSENLNANDYEVIYKLPYSPKIEYYDKALNKWFTMVIDKFDHENDTSAALKDIEFTFKLPEKQLQF
jgi:hypothetical protein